MTSAVCTLFEGHYHLGVAALLNSLYAQGYRGIVYVGYKGELPPWAGPPTAPPAADWPGSRTLEVAPDLRVLFLPLDTPHHMSNYKPDFMLRLWESLAREADALFYFDPDIVVDVPWHLFEEWVSCGVALCEDVNSPLAQHHPIRTTWRRYFGERGFTLRFKEASYANSGFVGVSQANRGFLTAWRAIQEAMAPALGGLQNSSFHDDIPLPFDPFGKTDQDALNATIEAWDGPASLVNKQGMAFSNGAPLMSHALGTPKPWHWPALRQALAGYSPRLADRHYWRAANGVINTQPTSTVFWRRSAIQLAALIGRFYGRR